VKPSFFNLLSSTHSVVTTSISSFSFSYITTSFLSSISPCAANRPYLTDITSQLWFENAESWEKERAVKGEPVATMVIELKI